MSIETLNMSRNSFAQNDIFSLLKLKRGKIAIFELVVTAWQDDYKHPAILHPSEPTPRNCQTLQLKDIATNLNGRVVLFRGKDSSYLTPPRNRPVKVFPVAAELICDKDVLRLRTQGDTLYYWRASLKGKLYTVDRPSEITGVPV